MTKKPSRGTIRNESANGLSNAVGTVAMARTGAPHSASAQFFINVKSNFGLDRKHAEDGWGYAVFGKVVDGMDVAHKIVAVKTGAGGPLKQNLPVKPVVILSVRRAP